MLNWSKFAVLRRQCWSHSIIEIHYQRDKTEKCDEPANSTFVNPGIVLFIDRKPMRLVSLHYIHLIMSVKNFPKSPVNSNGLCHSSAFDSCSAVQTQWCFRLKKYNNTYCYFYSFNWRSKADWFQLSIDFDYNLMWLRGTHTYSETSLISL